MIKEDFVRSLVVKYDLQRTVATKIVDTFFHSIVDALQQSDKLVVHNFGVFKKLKKNDRTGRNPLTGQEHTIQAREVISFRASKKLRDRLNEEL